MTVAQIITLRKLRQPYDEHKSSEHAMKRDAETLEDHPDEDFEFTPPKRLPKVDENGDQWD